MNAADGELAVDTTVIPTGKRRVPVAFGWHPYLRLAGTPRPHWTLRLPSRRHLTLDELGIPTGDDAAVPAEASPLGRRTFDDLYALGRDRRLAFESGAGEAVELRCDKAYPYAQVWVPAGKSFAALEPMAAPTNALGSRHRPARRARRLLRRPLRAHSPLIFQQRPALGMLPHHAEMNCWMIVLTIVGSVLWAKCPCPSRTRICALGIAATARSVAWLTTGTLSDPARNRVSRGDRVELAGLVPPVLLCVALSRDGRGGGEAHGPQRAGPKTVDLVIGHLQDVDQHGDDGRVVVAPGERRLDALDRPRWVWHAQAGLVEDEVMDVAGECGASHRGVGAVGVAPQRRPARRCGRRRSR